MVVNEKGMHTRAGTEVRLFPTGSRQLLGTRLIETGSGYNSQSVRPVHFGLPEEGPVDVELTLMTKGGRKIVVVSNVDPGAYLGTHLTIKVDADGEVVR
jgi:hypothetical protein